MVHVSAYINLWLCLNLEYPSLVCSLFIQQMLSHWTIYIFFNNSLLSCTHVQNYSQESVLRRYILTEYSLILKRKFEYASFSIIVIAVLTREKRWEYQMWLSKSLEDEKYNSRRKLACGKHERLFKFHRLL